MSFTWIDKGNMEADSLAAATVVVIARRSDARSGLGNLRFTGGAPFRSATSERACALFCCLLMADPSLDERAPPERIIGRRPQPTSDPPVLRYQKPIGQNLSVVSGGFWHLSDGR
jgi:hypothetical protein